jgi:hypothetical protein
MFYGTLPDMELSVAQAYENEIIKQEDVELSYQQILRNTVLLNAYILHRNDSDLVIGGQVIPDPLGTRAVVVQPLCAVGSSLTLPVFHDVASDPIPLPVADELVDSLTILQAKVVFEPTDIAQRAFYDASVGVAHYETVHTRLRYTITYNIKTSAPGVAVAPETDEGYIKIAELVLPAASDTFLIHTVTAQRIGEANTDWTNEKTRTVYLGGLDELKEQWLTEHTITGTHRDKVIHAANIDFGTGTNQVKASLIPLGTTASDGTNGWQASESIPAALQKEITIRQTLRNEFDVTRDDYTDTKNDFLTEHTDTGVHKDRVIHAANIDFGTGTNQVKASLIPLGTTASDGTNGWQASESIPAALQKEITIRQTLRNEFNVTRDDYTDTKEDFLTEHTDTGVHKDRVVHANTVDFGTGTNQVKASLIPAGEHFDNQVINWQATEHLSQIMQKLGNQRMSGAFAFEVRESDGHLIVRYQDATPPHFWIEPDGHLHWSDT